MRQDGGKMKRMPIWLKCFILCLIGVVVSTLVLSAVTFIRIYKDKEYIIETNAKNVSSYVDMNVVEKLPLATYFLPHSFRKIFLPA